MGHSSLITQELCMLTTLENAFWQVGILPETGASTAFGRINLNGKWVDLMRPTPPESYYSHAACASYILLPWSNRIRDGRLVFQGKPYQLRLNFHDGTAIHGTANEFPWAVASRSPMALCLTFNSAEFVGVNFPWAFSAQVEFILEEKTFTTRLSIKNEDTQEFPAGMGHHPFFMRQLGANNMQLQIPCGAHWNLVECLPTGELLPVTPRVDFQKLRDLGTEFIDDCYADCDSGAPMRMRYAPAGPEILMHADPIFQNRVFYLPHHMPFLALEPVTNANDGFNLYDQGKQAESGIFLLRPGESKVAAYSLEIV
jgi:aldose 1-epimerase